MKPSRILGLLFLALFLMGCGRETPNANAPTNTAAPSLAPNLRSLPTAAQRKLPTAKLWLGSEEMIAEIAKNDISIETGMMFRTNLAENEGMLFVFPRPHQASFWMKNTSLPLSAAYIDSDGTILEIHKLEPQSTNSVQAASSRVQFVLETPQGWFERHHVAVGGVVRTDQGSLRKIFLGRAPQ
jgi:uncharacterized protein